MSNPANYSPYNKTYKFILFQNQAYHQRNKRNISPVVRSNLRHSLSRTKPTNPELNLTQRLVDSRDNLTCRSSLFERREIEKAAISEPKRVVHKHWSFEKFQQRKISHENAEMVARILGSQCQVVRNEQAESSFRRHVRYQGIRRRYNQQGQRKDILPLCESAMLCPTLQQFNSSGLAGRFLEMDLSMSIKPATAQSMRRSARSGSPV